MDGNPKKSYSKYVLKENSYQMIGATADSLPSGFYIPYIDHYGNPYLVKSDIKMPKLYHLQNKVQMEILDDVSRFWASEERYRKFGSVYKRNILLYSAPGNGKTSLIHMIASKLINDYNGIIILINDGDQLAYYTKCVKCFREIEPNRKIVTIIEDFENLTASRSSTGQLLQLLDGNSQIDNMVTIATTNYPQQLESRFTCRPSRFNLVIEYKKPDENTRREYMQYKLSEGGINVNDDKVKEDIERLVGKTDNYTFDFVKEAIQCIYIDGIDEDTVFKRLNDLIDKKGNVKVTDYEGSSGIGFCASEGQSLKCDEDDLVNYGPKKLRDYDCDECCCGA